MSHSSIHLFFCEPPTSKQHPTPHTPTTPSPLLSSPLLFPLSTSLPTSSSYSFQTNNPLALNPAIIPTPLPASHAAVALDGYSMPT